MNQRNRHSQPFVMILVVTSVLLIVSQFKTVFSVAGFTSKKIDPFGDIVMKGKAKVVPYSQYIINDSIIARDSNALAVRAADPTNVIDYGTDSSSALAHFFGALNKVIKTKSKVRIAYFGDSMIEGDLISQDLRAQMQDAFGGNGVGFVPITSVVSGFRTSISHQFGGWTTHTLLDNIPKGHALGISGYTFIPAASKVDTNDRNSGSWVKYTAVKQNHLDKIFEAKLLYGKSSDENYVVINNNKYELKGSEAVNMISVSNPSGIQSLNARFLCSSPVDIFGFSLESDSGVFVDNYSFRGNSGFPLARVPKEIYSGTNALLSYDLIILEYGLNAVSQGVTDYSWYQRGMLNVINHIKSSFPNSSILLISVGDKSFRIDGTYQTDPTVPLLVDLQKHLAEETGCAYWSLYEAMGGSGSMVKWVEGDTVFANKDYTHFNFKGAHKVGKMLFSKLMSEYRDYNKKIN